MTIKLGHIKHEDEVASSEPTMFMSFEQPNDCTYTQLDKSAPRSDLEQTAKINQS